MNLGGSEIIVIVFVAILIFGPDKLPTIFRFFGKITAEIKDFQEMATSEIEKAANFQEKDSTESNTKKIKYSEEDKPVAPILDEDD